MSLTSCLLYALIAVASLLLYFIRQRLNYWKDRGIAHNEPSWISGNFQGVMKTHTFGEIFAQTYSKFKGSGPFAGFYFQYRPSVVLLDTELIKTVLIKEFSKFTDRGLFHNEDVDPLTGHLFLLDGQKWKTMRNRLSPTFTSGKMKIMYPTLTKVAEEFMSVMSETVQKQQQIEIKDLLARFTTDIIGSCAFGIECNSLRNPEAEFRIMGRRSLRERRVGKLGNIFVNGFPELARKLKIRVVVQDINDFFMRIVRETVAYREQHNIHRNDFLSILMELKNHELLTDEQGKSKCLSIEEMAAQAFVFFLGGFETSSSTMAFALYELALNQPVQQRLREEIERTLQKHGELSYECVKDMPYMDMIIYETLRKYPIVTHLNRQALQDYVVPGHENFVIAKGMPIIIPVLGIQHDPEYYPEPEKWDPERFNQENLKQRDSILWLPFGDGPRNCIGLRFGKMQTRVGLANLIRKFRFTASPNTEVPLTINKASFVMDSLHPITLNVEQL